MLAKASLTSHKRDGRHHGCCGLLHRCWLTTAFGFFPFLKVVDGQQKKTNDCFFLFFFSFLVWYRCLPEKSSRKWRSVPPTTGSLAH